MICTERPHVVILNSDDVEELADEIEIRRGVGWECSGGISVSAMWGEFENERKGYTEDWRETWYTVLMLRKAKP